MESPERIQIRTSEDGMEAWISVAEGPAENHTTVKTKLEAAGISHGLDPVAIEAAGRAVGFEAAMTRDLCIAQGTRPEFGTPPYLQLNDPMGPIAGVLCEDGRIDFRERLLILPIVDQEKIGRIVDGVPGQPGRDVFGEAVEPVPIEELLVKHGDGIMIDADGSLIATRSGARTIDGDGAIDVIHHHIHAGHVDLNSGNLDTAGSLEIARDVTIGMTVRAEGDMTIGGTVDGGRVYAEGSIEIKGGVIGRDTGAVHAGGDIVVRHALGMRLCAKGRLTVTRSVSTSQLSASEIQISGKMLSDSAHAETKIVLKEAGSVAGGPCLLRAAFPLMPDSDTSPPQLLVRSVNQLSSRKNKKSRKGLGMRTTLNKNPEIGERRNWRLRERDLQKTATIEIEGAAHAGCRIDFGVTPLVLEESVSARRFRVDPETQKIIMEDLA